MKLRSEQIIFSNSGKDYCFYPTESYFKLERFHLKLCKTDQDKTIK